ncbi:MAG: 1-phosphofructokinase family hexose kinase [Novosphingobium sp.]|nr:1-phosphofructokinase family hexose kinase [Novosphingobium sp.]
MTSIATLTLNPTIDVAFEIERISPTDKMRTDVERSCPGGGGINVARVFARLGGDAHCYYFSGGAMGAGFDGLIAQQGLDGTCIGIAGETRVALAVLERATGQEYRFTPRGPDVEESEWRECLTRIAEVDCDFFVASGSLPPGVPSDFYARVAAIMRERKISMALDTSGDALRAGLEAGGLLLVKPSLREFRELVGRDLETPAQVGEAAAVIVAAGQAEIVAVTMGDAGAVFASPEATLHLPAIPIESHSAVGAGDSFMAGMLHGLGAGWEAAAAFRYGMAAGAAAVLTPGTALAFPEDIDRLYNSSAAE